MEWIAAHKEWFVYASMPVTSAFVGWLTNWVAIKMTFYPLKFWGIPPYFGWQGIIPRKAHKMASKSVDLMTTKLIKVEEIFDKVKPAQMAKELAQPMKKVTNELVDEVGRAANPTVWDLTPGALREEIAKQVNKETGPLLESSIQEIKRNILSVFDLKSLVIKNLTGSNVILLNEMFQRCGKKEFTFIALSGIYFGFPFGIIQMLQWYFYQAPWTVPIIGIIVGYYTNWLALKMIFRPLREKKILGLVKYQGLFLKRQKEVSKEYADIVANKILSPHQVLENFIYGRAAEAFFNVIQSNVIRALARVEGIAQPILSFAIGSERYESLKTLIIKRINEAVPTYANTVEGYLGKAMDLEKTLYERLSNLPPEDFENLLRTAFQEDEWILILVGSALGFAVGLVQMFFIL
ncbi:MAG TPA: DUF445 family protein [Turneriella sp.]|nr:DUF445 family protein [Turneriella sp.]